MKLSGMLSAILCAAVLFSGSVAASEPQSLTEAAASVNLLGEAAFTVVKNEYVPQKDNTYVYNDVTVEQPVRKLSAQNSGQVEGSRTITVSRKKGGHVLRMKTSYSYRFRRDGSINEVAITGCEVETEDGPDSAGVLEVSPVTDSAGTDWCSGAQFLKKECIAFCDAGPEGIIRLKVCLRIYADGGCQTG